MAALIAFASTRVADRPADGVAAIEKALRPDPRLLGFHRLRTGKSGGFRHVDVHLVLEASRSLGEAHQVALEVETAITKLLSRTHVVTHLDPDTALPPERRVRGEAKRPTD